MMRLVAVAALVLGAHGFDRSLHPITSTMVAVYTPMKDGGFELDLDKIEPYAAFIKARNITNVLPAGSNGESLSLSVDERKALLEAWGAAALAHGLKIYMHIGSESVVDSAALAAHAATVKGCYGIVAMTPVYFKPTVASLVDFLAPVAAAAPELPFWYYHFPDDTGVLPGQAHEFLAAADASGKIPTLMGIKFTDYNLLDFQRCKAVAGGAYNMLYGRDEMALSAFAMGASAAVSSTVGYSPTLREAVALWERGDRAGALAAQARNADLCSYFGGYQANVQKNLMKAVGFDVGPSRVPKFDLGAADLASLAAKLNAKHLLD